MESHENRLIQRARTGDATAFRELVESCQQSVFRMALELTGDWDDADELSQQVFIKAYHALPRFRGEAKLMSWLYRILMNTYIDHTRRMRAAGGSSPTTDVEGTAQTAMIATNEAADNPEATATAHHIQDHINNALQNLAPQQRSVFIMRHYHDLPLKEIAGIMGLSIGTVKSQLFRAVRRMQKELSFYRAELGLEDLS
ncbi:sigma-70 family RNA polymerase sigma factor [Candidatus Neomarinimicrobiota bacterium]